MKPEQLAVLQIGKFYPVRGGVEKVMYDLMLGLSQRGVACDMLTAASEGPSCVQKINDKANLICTKTWRKVAATMISPSMIWKMFRSRKKYNIVHIHHPDPMAALALFCSGYKGKVVLHWHSDIVQQKQFLKLYMPLQKWLIRRADLILGTSPVYLEGSAHLSDYKHKTACLPIGIDPMPERGDIEEEVLEKYANKKIVFTLGRLVHYKGQSNLVQAAQYLSDDFIILIGGEGPLRQELQQKIDELNLNHKVKLLGRISDELAIGLYQACKVFCLSSVQKTEAFGIVLIEAMSKGKPIVATRIPESGVSWVNEDGYSGLNVEPQEPKQLAQAIINITSDEQAYSQFATQARKRYEKMFTKKSMIDNCLELYLSLWKE